MITDCLSENAKYNNLQQIMLTVAAGIGLSEKNKALKIAGQFEHIEVCEYLINTGADISVLAEKAAPIVEKILKKQMRHEALLSEITIHSSVKEIGFGSVF